MAFRILIKRIRACILGPLIAKRIIKNNPGSQIVFTVNTIGDQCLELSYLKAYKTNKKIVVLTSNKNNALFEYFRGVYDELYEISERELDLLLMFYKSDLGYLFRRKHCELISAYHGTAIRRDVLISNKFLSLDLITKSIYHLPLNSKPESIAEIIDNSFIEGLIKRNVIKPGKTVILNPYCNSWDGISFQFFEEIAIELKNRGLQVVTSVIKDQTPVRGTDGVDFTLHQAIQLLNVCGYVIGVRSGFLDLACFSNAKIASIDSKNYDISDACLLEKWWPNATAKTFSAENTRLVEEIVDYIFEE